MKLHPDKCTVLRVTNKKKTIDAKYVRYAIVSSAKSLNVDVSLD
jgi:hypothetical protein